MSTGPKTLVVCLDGVRPDALLAANTPFIQSLVVQPGTCRYSFHVRCASIPLSFPSWASIFTGQPEDVHGVHDNTPQPCGYPSIFHELRQRDMQVAAFLQGWYGLRNVLCGGTGNTFARETQSATYPANLRVFAKVEDTIVAATSSLETDTVADMTVVYLHDVDAVGHRHGFAPHIPEYVAALGRADTHVQRVWTAVRRRACTHPDEDWQVIVTTDHGGHETHGYSVVPSGQERYRGCHGIRGLGPDQTTFILVDDGRSHVSRELMPPPTHTMVTSLVRDHLVPSL